MSPTPKRLEQLVDLAGEPSSEKRRELLREITDVFLSEPQSFSMEETDHFDAILQQVSCGLETAMRAALSERMSSIDCAPPGILKQLANDDIEVAKPVIESSSQLSDDDLIEIVSTHGDDHMTAISRRPVVSEAVTEQLVSRGGDKVLHSLVQNDGAQISRKCMSKIITRSEKCVKLQEPLVQRQAIPADLLNNMYFFVSSKLKNEIMTKTIDMDPELIEQQLKESWSDIEGDARNNLHKELTGAEKAIAELVQLNQMHESQLIDFIEKGKRLEFLHGFAHLVDVDARTAQRILGDKSAESLMIAARAAQFDRSTFAKILFTIAGNDKSKEAVDPLRAIDLYDRVQPETAKRVMRFWRVRKRTAITKAA